MATTFSFREVRELVHSCPPGPERADLVDELLDIIASDINEQYPNAPEAVAFSGASAQVRMALHLPAPPPIDDDDSGGRGPRKPAPSQAPEAMLA